jgi:hypothetical protein
VALILDAGPLFAMADRTYSRRDVLRGLIEGERGPVVLSPYVAAEADHLIGRRLGPQAERLFLQDLASGTYEIEGPPTTNTSWWSRSTRTDRAWVWPISR